MKKGIIIGIVVTCLVILVFGIFFLNKNEKELFSATYYFDFGSRRVMIYENGDVYDDVEIEEPNHEVNYKFLKKLSDKELSSLKEKIKRTSDDSELKEYVIELVYGVKKFGSHGQY